MQAPVRSFYAIRPRASAAILAAGTAVAALFASTPFVIPEIAQRLDVSVGAAGLISTFQVGAFAVATWIGGRFVAPSRRALVVASSLAVAANLASVWAGGFGTLVAFRGVAGAAAGILIWIAWADGMQDPGSMRSVATVGPLATMIAAPAFGMLAASFDDRAIFLALAIVTLPVALLPAQLGVAPHRSKLRSPSRSNRVLLGGLFLLTLSGSSLFVYAATFATSELGLTPTAASLAYALNAGMSILATRLTARSGTAGLWLFVTAASAVVLIAVPHPLVYFMALGMWGFSFWIAVPAAFRALAARAWSPQERIGDAQSMMAFGRAAGPFVGGLLVGDGQYAALGALAGLGLATAASTVSGVELYRRREDRAVPAAG